MTKVQIDACVHLLTFQRRESGRLLHFCKAELPTDFSWRQDAKGHWLGQEQKVPGINIKSQDLQVKQLFAEPRDQARSSAVPFTSS